MCHEAWKKDIRRVFNQGGGMIIIDFILMYLIVFCAECILSIIIRSLFSPKDCKIVASVIQVALTAIICLKALGRI
jgi:hypothetical protein